MTNTIYFYNTNRDYDSISTTTTEEGSPAVSRRHTPLHHHHQQQRGLNAEAENNDGKNLATDLSGSFSSDSIAPASQSGGKLEYSLAKSFSFKELRRATRKFHNDGFLGQGVFGMVFKGWINENNLTATKPGKGIAVAIKRLSQNSFHGHDEWSAEVKYLGKLYHPNLVRLFGYCLDSEEHLLVYEFMPRGSLDKHLHMRNSSPLSWSVRMKIALGAAKGLAFLHSAAINIIHRSVGSANILLDSDYNAKLSDFGLATDGPTDTDYVSTSVVGDHGIVAPEYAATGHLTSKADVYSFGTVLIEILSGQRAGDSRIYMCTGTDTFECSASEICSLLESHHEGQCSLENARKAANLAFQCLARKAQFRPNMDEVVTRLEELQVC